MFLLQLKCRYVFGKSSYIPCVPAYFEPCGFFLRLCSNWFFLLKFIDSISRDVHIAKVEFGAATNGGKPVPHTVEDEVRMIARYHGNCCHDNLTFVFLPAVLNTFCFFDFCTANGFTRCRLDAMLYLRF